MTLSRKVILRNTGLVLGLLLLSGISLVGLHSLSDDVEVALEEYNDMGSIQKVALQVHAAITDFKTNRDFARSSLASARADMLKFIDYQKVPKAGEIEAIDQRDAHEGETTLAYLDDALKAMSAAPADDSAVLAQLSRTQAQLATMQHDMDETIQRTQLSANNSVRASILTITILSGVIAAAAVTLSVFQYLSVITPLRRLRRAVGAVAAGNFDNPITPAGDDEYRALTIDFNRMASELRDYYHALEEKVAEKSAQLAQSERLASVGFLAAGVAHEINNPLSIISGYAELAVKRYGHDIDPEIERTLSIIRDEAFRCKKITSKLLALSRGDRAQREVVSLADVASDVAELVVGLKRYQDRKLNLNFQDRTQYRVLGNPSELRQVLLNLTINGLEATSDHGQVTLEGHRENGHIRLLVKDDGRGMTPETINRVFEPFFTEKRGSSEPGTGLGLSITHAIVESHGGTIRAESAGPGQGSCFTVTLPAAKQEDES